MVDNIAEATQVDLQASLDGNEAAVDFGQDGVDDWMSANFVLHFDIDGLELSARAPMKFQYIESRKVSFLRMVSAGGLVGEGVLDDQTRLSVTGGNLSAKLTDPLLQARLLGLNASEGRTGRFLGRPAALEFNLYAGCRLSIEFRLLFSTSTSPLM